MTSFRPIFLLLSVLALLTAMYRYTALEVRHAVHFASALTALRLHDAELNRDLLLLRSGDLLHYDSVNHAIGQIRSDLSTLTAPPEELAPQVEALKRMARDKAVQLERFKSTHALVRNSFAYFLHLQAALAEEGPVFPALGATMLQFMRWPDPEHRRALSALLDSLPAEKNEPTAHLEAHTRLILQRLPKLDEILANLLATPLGITADRIASLHEHRLDTLQKRSDRFRLGLYLTAILLMIYLSHALQRLQRAHRRLGEEMQQRLETERQLLQARKMEAMGTFVSGIAHDFNNLLGSIRGYVVLAQEQLASGQSPAHALSRIEAIVGRGHQLIQRLLQFARPSGDDLTPLVPAAVIEEALGFLQPTLPDAIQLSFLNRLDDRCKITARAGELQQVIINLVRNAAEAIEGEGKITVTLEPASSDTIHIRVHDSGCGIPPSRIEQIFEPFASGKPGGLGTGLGLAIVQRIVRDHGGQIEVESEPARGTEFIIEIPKEPKSRSKTS